MHIILYCDVDGRHQEVHFDKITFRISKLCYGLSMDFVDPVCCVYYNAVCEHWLCFGLTCRVISDVGFSMLGATIIS